MRVQISATSKAEAFNLAAAKKDPKGNWAARAAANAATVARLQADLIPVPKPDCSKPLLP